jgi:serine/threonine protein phosphatase PrpC
MKIIAKTDIGLVRATNEDTFTYIVKDENNFMAFVCDGMGGHLGGSYASSKTVDFLNDALK